MWVRRTRSLHPKGASSFLRPLHFLPTVDNPLDPIYYRYLHQYPSLTGLFIEVDKDVAKYSSGAVNLAIPSITELTLEGDILYPALLNFLPSFTQLNSLTLDMNTYDPAAYTLWPMLASISSIHLTSLRLVEFNWDEEIPPPLELEPFQEALRRFPQLRHLALSGFLIDNLEFFDFLKATFRLRTLVLGLGVSANLEVLLGLIQGPKRMPTLAEIEINPIEAEEDSDEYEDDDDDGDDVEEDEEFESRAGSEEGVEFERSVGRWPSRVRESNRLFKRRDGTFGVSDEWSRLIPSVCFGSGIRDAFGFCFVSSWSPLAWWLKRRGGD